MIRRDTERAHNYSMEVFSNLEIYDIQGVLKEEDEYKCGIEVYQVEDFPHISFDIFDNTKEQPRKLDWRLCLFR